MARPTRDLPSIAALPQLIPLLTEQIHTVITEWALESAVSDTSDLSTPNDIPNGQPALEPDRIPSTKSSATFDSTPLASRKLYHAQRIIASICGKLTELVSEPSGRIIEVACQYWESRALTIAAERRIPDILESAKGKAIYLREIAQRTGVEEKKLGRILRCLCSNHIFQEVALDRFANNVVSASLVGNEPLRAYVLMFNFDLYTASDHLPSYLLSPEGHSYKVEETAFQNSVGTKKTRWDWLEEKITLGEATEPGPGYPGVPAVRDLYFDGKGKDEAIPRPELATFALAMTGGGKVFGTAHLYDYPWGELGEATVVDVGGGLGGFDIQLSHLYPDLKFVVQDRGPVISQAEKTVWAAQAPEVLAEGRVRFMEHDFFQVNPVKGAEIYWLRYIMHDWSDEYCIKILSAVGQAMSSASRLLICDQVMGTTVGCQELEAAPTPLPANFGYYTRYSHQRDLCMMGIINGIERTPQQFQTLVEAAGLKLDRVRECRSQVSIVEVRK